MVPEAQPSHQPGSPALAHRELEPLTENYVAAPVPRTADLADPADVHDARSVDSKEPVGWKLSLECAHRVSNQMIPIRGVQTSVVALGFDPGDVEDRNENDPSGRAHDEMVGWVVGRGDSAIRSQRGRRRGRCPGGDEGALEARRPAADGPR